VTNTPPTCPECGVPVQSHWDWCHACGFDPENRKPLDIAPGPRAAPPPGTDPFLSAPVTTAPNPPNPAIPRGGVRRSGAVARALLVGLVVVVALVAISVVVLHGTKTATKEPQATPDFASGMALVLSSDQPGSAPVALPDGLAGCTQAKLTPGDITTIEGWHTSGDDALDEGTEIRLFRAARTCDRAGLAQALNSQGNAFSEFGVNSIERQQCVNGHLIDFLAGQNDADPAATTKAQLSTAEVNAFQSCVPIAVALQAVILAAEPTMNADQASCLADTMAPSITWTQLFADTPATQAQFSAALTAAGRTCPS
jgi:hypothetical protein